MTFEDESMENVTVYISNDYAERFLSRKGHLDIDEIDLKKKIDEFYENKRNKAFDKENFNDIFVDLILVIVNKNNQSYINGTLVNDKNVVKKSVSLAKLNKMRRKRSIENQSSDYVDLFNPVKTSKITTNRRKVFLRMRLPKNKISYKLEKYSDFDFTELNSSILKLDEIDSLIIKNKTETNKISFKNQTQISNQIFENETLINNGTTKIPKSNLSDEKLDREISFSTTTTKEMFHTTTSDRLYTNDKTTLLIDFGATDTPITDSTTKVVTNTSTQPMISETVIEIKIIEEPTTTITSTKQTTATSEKTTTDTERIETFKNNSTMTSSTTPLISSNNTTTVNDETLAATVNSNSTVNNKIIFADIILNFKSVKNNNLMNKTYTSVEEIINSNLSSYTTSSTINLQNSTFFNVTTSSQTTKITKKNQPPKNILTLNKIVKTNVVIPKPLLIKAKISTTKSTTNLNFIELKHFLNKTSTINHSEKYTTVVTPETNFKTTRKIVINDSNVPESTTLSSIYATFHKMKTISKDANATKTTITKATKKPPSTTLTKTTKITNKTLTTANRFYNISIPASGKISEKVDAVETNLKIRRLKKSEVEFNGSLEEVDKDVSKRKENDAFYDELMKTELLNEWEKGLYGPVSVFHIQSR
jgi:hypothetical protein